MNKCKKVCDCCGKEEDTGAYTNLPKEWKNIKVDLGQYSHKSFDLCPECLNKMGLTVDKYNDFKSADEEPIEKKLFNLFCEIAQMAVGGNE